MLDHRVFIFQHILKGSNGVPFLVNKLDFLIDKAVSVHILKRTPNCKLFVVHLIQVYIPPSGHSDKRSKKCGYAQIEKIISTISRIDNNSDANRIVQRISGQYKQRKRHRKLLEADMRGDNNQYNSL